MNVPENIAKLFRDRIIISDATANRDTAKRRMTADSARPEDHADLVRLCRELGFKNAEEALRVVERYIPARKLRIQT